MRAIERKHVEQAIDEARRLGRVRFLEDYGFGEATKYFLITDDGERYDSKAIVGVAYGFAHPDEGPRRADTFSGGLRGAAGVLTRLRYAVEAVEVGEPAGHFDISISLHDVSKYALGDKPADWLIVQGQPRHLRSDGWVYVRTGGWIVGRVRAVGLGALPIRRERTGAPPGVRGPGPVVFVDPSSWDLSRRYDLTSDRRFYGQGTRYIQTMDDRSLRHWSSGDRKYYGEPIFPASVGSPRTDEVVEKLHSTTGDEAGADGWMVEGATTLTQVVAYERSSKARSRCIRVYGYGCSACGMNFEERYGDLGKEFIHVHHLREISSVGAEYVVDPVEDLRPLCPNCHAMVHRRSPALTIDELRAILSDAR